MPSKGVPAAGKARMLDAAELLFARNGYDGTSVRDITSHANVEVGLVTYHFKTKADLFRATMLRRAPDFSGALHRALDEVLIDNAHPRAILLSYLDTHISLVRSPDAGWRAYIRLAAETMLRAGSEELRREAAELYRPVMSRFERALIEHASGLGADEVSRVWMIFRRATLSVLIGDGDAGLEGAATDAVRDTFLDLFAAPFEKAMIHSLVE